MKKHLGLYLGYLFFLFSFYFYSGSWGFCIHTLDIAFGEIMTFYFYFLSSEQQFQDH